VRAVLGCLSCQASSLILVNAIYAGKIVVTVMHWLFSLIALVLFSCSPVIHQTWVPRAARPDTRSILGLNVDTVYMRQIVTKMIEAEPNEVAFCLYGSIEWDWSPENGDRIGLITVTEVAVAEILTATPRKIIFPKKPLSGCLWKPGLIGIAHDHPEAAVGMCKQSDADASLLFDDVRVLFAMALCANGTGEVLWQDGRRHYFLWYQP